MQGINEPATIFSQRKKTEMLYSRRGNMKKTIQDVIDLIKAEGLGATWEDTVDTFKCGDPSQEITGIVTTFTATTDVLRRAVALGANLIITHEPTFYDHRDETGWLGDDPVYQAKRLFIEQHRLTIWRFHDYWHFRQPDGIVTGMLKALGWEQFLQSDHWGVLHIPGMTVAGLVTTLKERLALPQLRLIGKPEQSAERVGLVVGAPGDKFQMSVLRDVDAVICGETSEWSTCEYMRDALALGFNKALIIVGHAKSEEEGMRYLAQWLQPKVPEIPVTYTAVGDPIVIL